MASNLAYGPNITQQGLEFCVDVNNAKSYPGSGTTWYDLCGNKNLTLTTITSASSDGIDFDGTDDKIALQSWPADLNIDSSSRGRTWEVWCKPDVVGSSLQGIYGHKAAQSCSYWCNGGIGIQLSQYIFYWYDNSSYQYLLSGTANCTAGQNTQVVATFMGGFVKLYVNGNLVAATTTSTNMNYGSGMSYVEAGYNSKSGGQEYYNGKIYCLRFYKDKALSHAEIKQNYNTFKARFGL